ncbi:ankyrin repeat and LEM domain-containing protein 1 isoform 2-T2 [Pluvialis apricaria]
MYRHVTPRTKSRLQASAAQLGASSSSSLFDESLEMPRRPPRLRAPRGVPRDPATTSGHCVTPGVRDVSSGDGEGTGSLDDTEILPGAPSQPSSPPGASSSPGSSPTVLLLPGDRGHPQDSPSDAQGSPGSSPTVLLVPGDHGHPQDSPSGAQGSLCAAGSPNPRALKGGSGWQDAPALGTQQTPWPHGSFSHLPAPRQPGGTTVEPRSPAVPLSPAGSSTHRSAEHLKDEERGQAPTEWHSPDTEATTSPEDAAVQDGQVCTVPPRPLSDETLRRRLRALGDNPGPVTELTRRLYLRRLEELARGPRGRPAGHSPELAAALRTGCIPDCAQDELALVRQFDRPDRSRHWREGLLKSNFNYILLDPRTTQNLPLRSHRLSPAECFRTFIKAIFYVGKGTRARPYCHLAEALSQHRAGTQKGCPKVRRILEIWASGAGRYLRALLPEHHPGGGLHAGGLPRGGSGAAEHHQPEEGELLRRGGELASGAAPASGRSHAAQGHAHLPGRGRAAAAAGGHPGWALSTLFAPPLCPVPRRWLCSGRGFYVVNTGENFSIFLFP